MSSLGLGAWIGHAWRWGGAPPGGFAPTDIASLVQWWDVDSALPNVATWASRLPGGVALVKNGGNGGIREEEGMDRVCNWADGVAQSAMWDCTLPAALPQPFTTVIVGSIGASVVSKMLSDPVNTANDIRVYQWNEGRILCGWNNFIGSVAAYPYNESHLIGVLWKGASSWLDTNGARVTGNAGTDQLTGIRIGDASWAGWDTGSPTSQTFSDILVFDDELTPAEWTGLSGYLTARWM